RAESDRAVILLAVANPAHCADAPVFPLANDYVNSVCAYSRDRFAARPHQRVKHLDRVNAVPEKVGVMRLGRRGAVCESPEHSPKLSVSLHRLKIICEPQAGRTEKRRPRFARHPDDLTRVGVTGGEWLVNKHSLFRGEDRPNLAQMRPPVN